MRYTHFEFENFKGIREARLDLAPPGSASRVYALVGLNESGKTTVLEAIDRFSGSSEEEVSPKQLSGWHAVDEHLLIPIAERTNFNGEIVIRCGLELDENDVRAAKAHLRTDANGYRLESLDPAIEISDRYEYKDSEFQRRHSTWKFKASGRTRQGKITRDLTFSDNRPVWLELVSYLRTVMPTIWLFPNFLFEFPEKIFLEHEDGESESNRFYRALLQDILDALDRDLALETHVVERARSDARSAATSLQQVLLEASRHVTDTVVSAWNRIFAENPLSGKRVVIELGEDPAEGNDEEGIPHDPRLWVQFRLEDADGMFTIRERSLGFRWFFVYLLITTYRGQRKASASDMLFLFDEPASNLHPTAQSALLSSLRELSKKAVIVYTTHSHHLIEPRWLGTTSVVANEGLGADAISTAFSARRTDIRITPYRQFAANHPDQSHYFQPILDVLDYAPSHVELVPDAVMVEGKSDFYLLSYFQSVIESVPADERLALVPGGGAGTLDDLMQLYIGWSRPFVALLDSDRQGRSEAARYEHKFGRIIERNIVLLADASGRQDVKGIESLLTESDRLALARVVDPQATTYRKKTLALGVQEALIAEIQVKLSAQTTKALRKVVKSLRARLGEVAEDLDA